MTGTENKAKELLVLQSVSLRELVETANKIGIQKEDIVSLLKQNDTFFLLYYK